jgi:putative transposase
VKRSQYTEGQVVRAIDEHERGKKAEEICRELGVSPATFYAWKKQYAGLRIAELRELRQLREENSRLKRLVADLTLDRQILQEAMSKKA